MSYAAIRQALASKLAAVSKVGKAHAFVRYTKASTDSDEWKTLFVENNRVNVWQITRVGFSDVQDPGDDTRVIRTHQVEVYAFISQRDASLSENYHQDALDEVATALQVSPRNLGGACHVHGLAEVANISRVMFYETILCHEATIRLTVEEHL